jgi:uncharacterized protein (TIGR02231 family)
MKKIILQTLLLMLGCNLYAQQETKIYVDSKIESAIVYLNGAEVERNAKVNLVKGNNLIVFRGLSPMLNSKSIRVSSDAELSILSISTKINYLTKKNEVPLIKKLKDSLLLIENEIRFNNDELNAYSIEKEMIMSNKNIGGSSNGVSIAELKQSADFFRQRIMDINKQIARLDKRNMELKSLSESYHSELNETKTRSVYRETDVNILLSSESAIASNLKLQYMVSDAGWVPCYEIKADDLSKPIELVYKAKVFNNTAIPWENVKMKLSIADPSVSISIPELKPWYLDYYVSYPSGQQKGNLGFIQNAVSDNLVQEISSEELIDKSYDEFDIPDLNTEFDIKSTYTIPADDKPYMVDIEKYNLPATFKHFAVTKLDKGVFLLGRITGWQDLNLVDGYANVYFKGTYLGESLIKTRNVKDTLDLSLGRDEKVLVTRTKLKEYSSKQLIGTKLKETLSFELVARNNRKSPVDIEILDQIPISKNSEIEVKELELSGGEYNPITGKVSWRYNLKAGESKKMTLTFYIKYPKNQTIEVQQMKRMELRKF